MTTKFEAQAPRATRVGARRLAAVVIGAVVALAGAAVWLSPAVKAQQAGHLDGRQISEMYNPGVVMIVTIFKSTVSVPQWSLPDQSIDALHNFAAAQAKTGVISGSVEDVLRTELQEMANNPTQYLVPTTNMISKELPEAFSGSGFILTPDGYIVTNAHVVSMAPDDLKKLFATDLLTQLIPNDVQTLQNDLKVQLSDEEQKMFQTALLGFYTHYMQMTDPTTSVTAQIGIAIPGLSTLTKPLVCDVLKVGEITPGKDVAVLKIEQTNLPTVPVGDDTKMQVGDKVFVIGYPGAAELGQSAMGSEPTLTSGEVSARQTMPGGWQAIQTDAAINHGNSGGPAFNDQGQVIGIATFGADNAQNINFLVPMSIADEFLNGLNIKPQESQLSSQYIQAINDFEAKDCSKALGEFEQIKNLNPGFPYVQDYISQATSCKEAQPLVPMNYLIVGGVVLVIAIAIGVWAMVKKKPAPAMAGAPAHQGAVGLPASAPPPQGLPAGAYGAPVAGSYAQASGPARSYGSLQGTSGATAGKRYEITKQGLLIGRDSAKCQIVLPEDAVSKEHAWVVPVDEGVVLIDRGSTNGVFLNSLDSPKVSKVTLHHGDKIYIGKGAACFTYLSS